MDSRTDQTLKLGPWASIAALASAATGADDDDDVHTDADALVAHADRLSHSDTPKNHQRPNARHGRTRHSHIGFLLSFPVLAFVAVRALFTLVLYAIVRSIVTLYEYSFAVCRDPRRRSLLNQLHSAKSYAEYTVAAKLLDSHVGADSWKASPHTDLFDVPLLEKIIRRLRRHRIALKKTQPLPTQPTLPPLPVSPLTLSPTMTDVGATQPPPPSARAFHLAQLCSILRHSACKPNIAGIENEEIYSRSFWGTKYIVDEFVVEVVASLECVASASDVTWQDKLALFRALARGYGRSSLCLSGGALFGYMHLGVVQALLAEGLMPKVLTGTSAGSLMGSVIATRTDKELAEFLVPQSAAHFRACIEPLFVRLRRLATSGSLFDPDDWFGKMEDLTMGHLTFLEAYQRTGRIFNITVVSTEPHAEPKLLNYMTTPDVIITTAVLASSALPGVLPPIQLLSKSPDGTIRPFWGAGSHWRDGSLRSDIPDSSLLRMFNVHHTIVSQFNPHIILFFYNSKGSAGTPNVHRHGHGWRGGFIFSALVQHLLLDLQRWLSFIRDMNLLPRVAGADLSNLWLQRFWGSITILPRNIPPLKDFLFLLSDPSQSTLERLLDNGRYAAFPKIHAISNRLRIEQCLDRLIGECRDQCRQQGALDDRIGQLPSPHYLDGLDGLDSDDGSTDHCRHSRNDDYSDDVVLDGST